MLTHVGRRLARAALVTAPVRCGPALAAAALAILTAAGPPGCKAGPARAPGEPAAEPEPTDGSLVLLRVDTGRCAVAGARAVQHDLDGDGRADLVSLMVPDGSGQRVLCRQGDLNGDGKLDAFFYYDERGELEREQYDMDYDGRIDLGIYSSAGAITLVEQDTTRNGVVDVWRRYDAGRITRIEVDRDGDGIADMFVFYVQGMIDRIGYDTDQDGTIDLWDHDAARRARLARAARRPPSVQSDERDEFIGPAGERPAGAEAVTGAGPAGPRPEAGAGDDEAPPVRPAGRKTRE